MQLKITRGPKEGLGLVGFCQGHGPDEDRYANLQVGSCIGLGARLIVLILASVEHLLH
ncbi:hypothetical protein OLZ32_23490 [Rhizobium sp. 1AS11]|uniref:hypothetical protein n=1 Tax=Rhizobium acaciae TaxID=2989736 RepID=UPI002223E4BD|nr:hypothetical protein [Rhizobium acaciae]MCW1411248.1 hypothetical protein [Rhizobium acaciae]MCW1743340.1 hypothetical protein [Rhizobium acaciae]